MKILFIVLYSIMALLAMLIAGRALPEICKDVDVIKEILKGDDHKIIFAFNMSAVFACIIFSISWPLVALCVILVLVYNILFKD